MSSGGNRSDYWLKHWEERSQLKDSIAVSGWGSKDIKEYLYDIGDICKKLGLERDDELLNIGCGNGLMEIVFSCWVKKVVSVDFSSGMLKLARENNREYKNVKFFNGNVLNLSFLNNKFNKVLCNSIIQYLDNLKDVKKALIAIKNVTKKKSVILIAANPDKNKFKEFLSGYDKLNLKKEEIAKKKAATRAVLWTYPDDLKMLAESLGYSATIQKMHPGVWQSCYMYDMVLKNENTILG